VTSEVEQTQRKRIVRATVPTEEECDIEDNDPRFLHIMKSADGADLKRKFFKNTDPEYLM